MELEKTLRERCEAHGQGHVFRFWETLNAEERGRLLEQLAQVEFPLMERLAREWILETPPPARFDRIEPVPVLPAAVHRGEGSPEAWDAGEEALRAGKVGLFLVAGGQGTRLGFPGPKGCYPIGPLTGKPLFQYHAEKLLNLRRRFGCTLPWYIMVSAANEAATRAHFEENGHFGLGAENVVFLRQRMVPCMDGAGRFMLESPGSLAMNPNGHGGCIPAMVENGVLDDARARGVEMLSYFQVDNWAVKVADPYFIGWHVLKGAEMSSKVHRKNTAREAVGVHCLCDGVYQVIEYSELDIYPQLLETDAAGNVRYFAGNPAMHILSVEFVQGVFNRFDRFPWHLARKKIPFVNDAGELVKPDTPNGCKFETFVFDALQFVGHAPVAVEIGRLGEYTPTKQFEGDNSVVASRQSMSEWWGGWFEAAGAAVPRNGEGRVAVQLEVSPLFALTRDEFVEKAAGRTWDLSRGLSVDADGNTEAPAAPV